MGKILEAKRQRQWHAMWVLAKRLLSSRIGPRRPLYGQLPGSVAEISEWVAHLQQDGPDGGCKAHVVSLLREAPSETQLARIHSASLYQPEQAHHEDDDDAADEACVLAHWDLLNIGEWLAHRANSRGNTILVVLVLLLCLIL